MVIWLTGLSGSGKTTIGRRLIDLWRPQAPNTVLLDGDEIRKVLGLEKNRKYYTLEGRRHTAARIGELCAWLDRQGINVVCCTISLFRELHDRNRAVLSGYFEVYLDAPVEALAQRDTKNLYAPALKGDLKNVVGVDLPFDVPADPDMVIDAAADRPDFQRIAATILKQAMDAAP